MNASNRIKGSFISLPKTGEVLLDKSDRVVLYCLRHWGDHRLWIVAMPVDRGKEGPYRSCNLDRHGRARTRTVPAPSVTVVWSDGMGFRSWMRRILRRKDAARADAPRFERLEPRILFSSSADLYTGTVSIGHPSWLQAVVHNIYSQEDQGLVANDDMYSTIEDQPRSVPAPGLLANDVATGTAEVILVEGPSYGQLSIEPDGSFIYTPRRDWSGQDRFTYALAQAGSLSNTATVLLPVAPANDPPTFVPGPDIVAQQDCGMCRFETWARSISCGPADESNQALSFVVLTDRPDLFKTSPAISLEGTLTFEPAKGAAGKATVMVQLKDDGGTANGGLDVSQSISFCITIEANQQTPPMNQVRQWFLPSIRQGHKDNDGILVAELIDAALGQEQGAFKPRGLAVVYADWHLGSWEYSTNGRRWEPITRAEETAPTFLLADSRTRIRFVPNPDFKGTISKGLVCRPWDGNGTANGTIRFIDTVGEDHLGIARLQIGIVVNPVIRLQTASKGNSIVIYQQSGRIVANSNKETILDLPIGCFEQLIVVGAKGTKDTITIDAGLGGPLEIKDGVVFEADDKADLLVVRATSNSDLFELFDDKLVVNGLEVTATGLHQLQLHGAAGDDVYRIHTIGIPTLIVETTGRDMLDFFYALSSLRIDLAKSNGQWQQVLASSASLALKGTLEDVLGTAWSDIIFGNNADNRIWGWCGDDIIYGGGGSDWLFGQTGNDKLFGQLGSDLILGGDGDDLLDGGDGNDVLIGGRGSDILKGSNGQDILVGGTTIYDEDRQALSSIMAIWTSRQSCAARVARLTSNVSQIRLIVGLTVWADPSDVFKTDSGPDLWF